MNKKFLKWFLTLGNILAISPWSDKRRYGKNNKLYQMYVVLVFAGNLEEYFRLEKTEIEIYKSGKSDIVLVLLNWICVSTITANFISMTVVLNFVKFEKWNLMWKYLQLLQRDLEAYRSEINVGILGNIYVDVFVMTAILWINNLVCFWGIGEYSNNIIFEYIILFHHWYGILLIYITVAKIYGNVRKLGLFLENFTPSGNGKNGKSIKFITSIRPLYIYTQFLKSYRNILDAIQIFNDIFGYQMVLLNLIGTFEVLRGINYIIFLAKTNKVLTRMVVATFLQIATIMLGVVLIILMCTGVTRDAKHFLYLLHQMEEDSINMKYKRVVIQLVQHLPLRFSAARFFEISKYTILGIIANCTTYFIVLVQFYQKK